MSILIDNLADIRKIETFGGFMAALIMILFIFAFVFLVVVGVRFGAESSDSFEHGANLIGDDLVGGGCLAIVLTPFYMIANTIKGLAMLPGAFSNFGKAPSDEKISTLLIALGITAVFSFLVFIQ